jgi:glycosyltransferase involved in cell wall biosynthesis
MPLRPGVTAVIPSIPPRADKELHRAVDSVLMQTLRPDALVTVTDHGREGGAATRNRGLAMVDTRWTAFLDDDDWWDPEHLERMFALQNATGADLVYPWFTVVGGFDPFGDMEGQPFSASELERRNYIPVTVLVRTDLLRDVGGFQPLGPSDNPNEDWGAWRAMLAEGAQFVHLNRRTWYWNHGPGSTGNTSGSPERW